PQLDPAPMVARTKEKQISLTQPHTFEPLNSLDFIASDCLSRFEPVHATESGDIEQNPPPHDAVYIRSDIHQRGAAGGNARGRLPVVEFPFVRHMTERIEMCSRIAMEFAREIVSRKLRLPMRGAKIVSFHHVMHGRARIIRPGNGVDGQGK